MEKHVFVKDGKVVSIASVMAGTVECSIEGAERFITDGDFKEGMTVEVVDGILTKVADAAVTYPKVSPVQYKLLFTVQERIAIATAKATDPVLQDLYGILDDPRLTEVDLNLASTQGALDYLISQGLIEADRKAEILTGELK